MKRLYLLAVLGIAALLLNSGVYAVEEGKPFSTPVVKGEEHHHAISAHHKNAAEHAKALHHHAARHSDLNKAVAREHAEEIEHSLAAAERHLTDLEKVLTPSEKEEMANSLETIQTQLSAAKEDNQAILDELKKARPSSEAVKTHAARVHSHVTKAEAEHKKMMEKRGVREPAEPAREEEIRDTDFH